MKNGLWTGKEFGAVHVLLKNKETWTKFRCPECNVGLCSSQCFKIYLTQTELLTTNCH